MPTTLAAALIYVLLMAPGLVYVTRRSHHRPSRTRSVFWETATIVFCSAIFIGTCLLIILGISLLFPPAITSIADFLNAPERSFYAHPRLTVLYFTGVLGSATLLAWGASSQTVSESSVVNRLKSRQDPDTTGWHEALNPQQHSAVYVGIKLKSGGWVDGYFAHHSDVSLEDSNRSLTLQEPIRYLSDGEGEAYTFPYDRLVVSASEIEFITTVACELDAATPTASYEPSTPDGGQ